MKFTTVYVVNKIKNWRPTVCQKCHKYFRLKNASACSLNGLWLQHFHLEFSIIVEDRDISIGVDSPLCTVPAPDVYPSWPCLSLERLRKRLEYCSIETQRFRWQLSILLVLMLGNLCDLTLMKISLWYCVTIYSISVLMPVWLLYHYIIGWQIYSFFCVCCIV